MPENETFSGAEWSSSSTKATVDKSSGVVTAKETGKVTITGYYTTPYKTPGIKYTVTIQPAVPSVQTEEKTIKVNETFNGVLPETEGFSGVKWVSDKPNIATVDNSSGLITGKTQGSCVITGSYTSPYETPIKKYTLTVNPAGE